MSQNPINLTVRFLLEVGALISLGAWGWQQFEGLARILAAVGIPLLAAILWGTFAVPEDPSRSGKAPVPVPGLVRLILELAFFGLAVWALFAMQAVTLAWILLIAVILHYLVSYDRIAWLLKR